MLAQLECTRENLLSLRGATSIRTILGG